MTGEVRYRAVRPEDCSRLAELHRRSFPASLVARSIFVSHRVDRFLADRVVTGDAGASHRLVAAEHAGELRGYAWFRDLGTSWHLNYVAVHPDSRSLGIGARLFELWVEGGRQRRRRRFTLDVTSDNDLALAWYRRRGLSLLHRSLIVERPLEAGARPPSGAVELLDREAADRHQASYGFSELELRQGTRDWRVGRLGNELFRMSEPPSAELETTLHWLDPHRRLLLLERLANGAAAGAGEMMLRLEAEGL